MQTTSPRAVLLPAARIHLHSRTASLLESFGALSSDWRFARVTASVEGIDLTTAITKYGASPSPDLVLVETDDISETFTDRLGDLANVCQAGTACIIVGPVNDVYLYRSLVAQGVSDYLVNPIAPDVLAEVIANTLISKLGVSQSRMLAVLGSKGGVGASTCARMLADLIAHRGDEKTLLLDAAGGWSYTTIAHGHEPLATLNEACRAAGGTDQDSFKRLVVQASANLSLLGTGADAMLSDPVNAAAMEGLLTRVMTQTPMVIVDLSSTSGEVAKAVLARADRIALVTNPTLPALRGARTLLSEIKNLRGGDDKTLDLIVNMAGRWGQGEMSAKDIEMALGLKPSAVVPDQPRLVAQLEGAGEQWRQQKGVAEMEQALAAVALPFCRNNSAQTQQAPAATGLLSGLLKRK